MNTRFTYEGIFSLEFDSEEMTQLSAELEFIFSKLDKEYCKKSFPILVAINKNIFCQKSQYKKILEELQSTNKDIILYEY